MSSLAAATAVSLSVDCKLFVTVNRAAEARTAEEAADGLLSRSSIRAVFSSATSVIVVG